MKIRSSSPTLSSDVVREIKKTEGDKEEIEFHKSLIIAHGDILLSHAKAKKFYDELKSKFSEAPEDFIIKVVDALPLTVEAVKLIGTNTDFEVSDDIANEIISLTKELVVSMKKKKSKKG